jgi:hypothetical protein
MSETGYVEGRNVTVEYLLGRMQLPCLVTSFQF